MKNTIYEKQTANNRKINQYVSSYKSCDKHDPQRAAYPQSIGFNLGIHFKGFFE